MKTVKDVLVEAKKLIEATGWCQGQYAMKNGKTHYDFIHSGIADSYCLVGACDKVAFDFWAQEEKPTYENQKIYNKLSWDATHLVVSLQEFDGCPADWNDQDEESRRIQEFMNELRAKAVPRDKAKPMIAQFKQELKKQNIPPIITKEKVLAAIDLAISYTEQQLKEQRGV